MSDVIDDPDWSIWVRQLTVDPNAASLPDRRALVRKIAAALSAGRQSADLLRLIQVLAGDPKGVVRADVADLLIYLPDQEFLPVFAKLSKDDYAFARRAAERAFSRRKKGEDALDRRLGALDGIEEDRKRFRRKYGEDAGKAAEEMAQRLYEFLVGGTVHSMRTVVSPLQTRLEKLKNESAKWPSEQRETLRKCVEAAARLHRNLDVLLDYARKPGHQRRTEKLADVVRDAILRAREDLESRKAMPDDAMITNAIAESITVWIAREEMIDAFTNLMKNALEALPAARGDGKRNEISITATLTDEAVEVVLADNGIGLTDKELNALRAFRPGATSLKPTGNGIGLPWANKTVRAHGGSISIDSGLSAGTKITVSLPLGEEHENA